MQRDSLVTELRPASKGKLLKKGEEEKFNFEVFLPIFEFQKDLITEIFSEYVNRDKSGFDNMPVDRKILFTATKVNNDLYLKKTLQGVVLGLMSVAEYKKYVSLRDVLEPKLTAGAVRVISDSFIG